MTASIATPSGDHRTLPGIACGIGAGALWGLVFLAPAMVPGISPLLLAIGRYLAYGAISAVLIAPRWRGLMPLLERRDWLSLVWLSLAGNTLYYILLSTAVQKAGIATTSLVIGFLPVAVTIIGSRDRHAVPLRRLLPSLLLCMAGVICIGWQALAPSAFAPSAFASAGQRGLGFVCAIGALIAWTAYAVGNARALTRIDRVSAHDWNLLMGVVTGAQALLLIPLGALAEPLRHTPTVWAQLAGMSLAVAVIASFCGNALWNRMSRLLPLTMVGQMILFETLFALLYGLLWEHRLPLPLEVAAFALVTASVLTCIAAHRGHAPTEGHGL